MVVMFNVLGDVAAAVVVVVWRRNWSLKRRIMKASGMIRGTRIDGRAKLLIVLLYPAASIQWYGMK